MNIPASLEKLVQELARLPGIGQKTAQRLAFSILRYDPSAARALAEAVLDVKEKIRFCEICFGFAEEAQCDICRDQRRDERVICVVEQPPDIYVIERSGVFRGRYHVLMGVISPLDGIGPQDLTTEDLKAKVGRNGTREVILATNPDMEGESTAIYIARMLKGAGVKVTRIARGLPVGGDIEYADPVTLKKSMEGRMEIEP